MDQDSIIRLKVRWMWNHSFLPFYAALNLFLESEMIMISISSHFRDNCYKETENLLEDWNSLGLNEENVENNASY